jgi:hypothetical protein
MFRRWSLRISYRRRSVFGLLELGSFDAMKRMNQSPSIGVERVRAQDDQRKRNQGQTFNGPAAAVICGELADQLEVTAPTLIWQERCSKNASMAFSAFANRKPTDGVPDGSPNSQVRPEFARQSQLAADGHRIRIVFVTGSDTTIVRKRCRQVPQPSFISESMNKICSWLFVRFREWVETAIDRKYRR